MENTKQIEEEHKRELINELNDGFKEVNGEAVDE